VVTIWIEISTSDQMLKMLWDINEHAYTTPEPPPLQSSYSHNPKANPTASRRAMSVHNPVDLLHVVSPPELPLSLASPATLDEFVAALA
jgi:hypothetical protein